MAHTFKCGEYNAVQSDADSAEVCITFTESKKFRFSSSSCLSKGFFEYYVDNTAKGKWKFDKTKNFVVCTASKAKSTNWNTEDSASEQVTKLDEWSRNFNIDQLNNESKYSYRPLPPKKDSPPSTASPRVTSAGSDKSDAYDEAKRNTPEPRPPIPSGLSATVGRPGRSRKGQNSLSATAPRPSSNGKSAAPPSGPLPKGGRRPGSNGSDGGTPRQKQKLEAARIKDREMNGNPDNRAEMIPRKKGGIMKGKAVPATRVNGGNGFGGLGGSDNEDLDESLGKFSVSSEEKDILTEQETAFITKKFLEHKIQKAQRRVDEAREEFNSAKAALSKLKKSYRQASIAKV